MYTVLIFSPSSSYTQSMYTVVIFSPCTATQDRVRNGAYVLTIEVSTDKPGWVFWVELQTHDAASRVDDGVWLVLFHCPSVQIPCTHCCPVSAPVLVVIATKCHCQRAACSIPCQPSHLKLSMKTDFTQCQPSHLKLSMKTGFTQCQPSHLKLSMKTDFIPHQPCHLKLSMKIYFIWKSMLHLHLASGLKTFTKLSKTGLSISVC